MLDGPDTAEELPVLPLGDDLAVVLDEVEDEDDAFDAEEVVAEAVALAFDAEADPGRTGVDWPAAAAAAALRCAGAGGLGLTECTRAELFRVALPLVLVPTVAVVAVAAPRAAAAVAICAVA